jgi:DNA-binding NarL/FixJ family response regulator
VRDGEEAQEERTGLVVVDPESASRAEAESLEEALERPILAVDPSEWKPEESEEIRRAAAFVVCWDLGFRSGAELLEEIRASELLKDRKILIATDAPTRRLVLLAMALGADGICRQPYDGAEIAAALERLGLPRPESAT